MIDTTAANAVLTEVQRDYLKGRAAEFLAGADFRAEVERRRSVAREFKTLVDDSALFSGKSLTREQLANLIRLQWSVQNLNAMSIARLLGTYPYYRFFKGFDGDAKAFAAHMAETRKSWRPGSVGYPGVDLNSFSSALRAVLTASQRELPSALRALVREPGVGAAFASATLHLYQPERHALINSASVGVFKNPGPLKFSSQQLASCKRSAEQRYGIKRSEVGGRTYRILVWGSVLEGVRDLCNFSDFFEVDHLVWRLTKELKVAAKGEAVSGNDRRAEDSADAAQVQVLDAVETFLAEIEPERLEIRKKAEDEAREIISSNLGRLSEAQLRTVLRLFNTDYARGKMRVNRFLPAFAGKTTEGLFENLDVANRWIRELWSAPEEDLPGVLDSFWTSNEISGAGRSFPTGILYLRDPERFTLIIPTMGKGYAKLTGKPRPKKRRGSVYMAYTNGVNELKETLNCPPQAVDLILWKAAQVAKSTKAPTEQLTQEFGGFNEETFKFLSGLGLNNNDDWFKKNRTRFIENVRRPLAALVRDLGRDFIERVNPDLEHAAKSPHTLSRIRKNIWGKKSSEAYWPHFWAAFHRAELKKTEDFQLYMYLHAHQFMYGLYFGSAKPSDIDRLRRRLVDNRNDSDKIMEGIVRAELRFERKVEPGQFQVLPINSPRELADALGEDQEFNVGMVREPDDALVKSPNLKEDVQRTLETVYPLFVLATSEHPTEDLQAYDQLISAEPVVGDGEDEEPTYTLEQLLEETLIPADRVSTLEALLADKRQMIFYGPPGTGKTWLAERFAKFWTGAKGDVKTIQFHPSYGYEDFVEGIRPRVDGDSGQVTYEIVPGVFRSFCDVARKAPSERFVLVIDEINRGNLPRIFGELLYLLERRGEAVHLPISGKAFRIPKNLYVIGTMNTADHSIALLDAALRRRFHFDRFDPDSILLREWLQQSRPEMVAAADVLEHLNATLTKKGIDKDRLIGHSHFMLTALDDESLEHIWNHSVFPTIEEFFYGRRENIDEFSYERFVEPMMANSEADDEDVDA